MSTISCLNDYLRAQPKSSALRSIHSFIDDMDNENLLPEDQKKHLARLDQLHLKIAAQETLLQLYQGKMPAGLQDAMDMQQRTVEGTGRDGQMEVLEQLSKTAGQSLTFEQIAALKCTNTTNVWLNKLSSVPAMNPNYLG